MIRTFVIPASPQATMAKPSQAGIRSSASLNSIDLLGRIPAFAGMTTLIGMLRYNF
jgi:hypothetical protein